MQLLKSYWWILVVMVFAIIIAIVFIPSDFRKYEPPKKINEGIDWDIPDALRIPSTPEGDLIRYGKDLIAYTAVYFGPKGKVAAISNGMNCQNCHLDAGTRLMGNNYSAVFSCYPKFRARSAKVESIYKRVNDCLERSLNGKSLDTNSREMKAIYAYIKWLGKNVPLNSIPIGAGIANIPLLERAADPVNGKMIYIQKCKLCHAEDGKGLLNADSTAYTYPPLWGEHSYNNGAGLYRISRLAGYIRYNMPLTITEDNPPLTDEQAWDVAAFINSQPRPEKKYTNDWPDISLKPFDHPYGPYTDSFSEHQHKYGPFAAIKKRAK